MVGLAIQLASADRLWVEVIYTMTTQKLQQPLCGFAISTTSLCQQIKIDLLL